ncbi:hypothetical protein NUW58_g2175 [Xylaria curta]|uniref:Uncharacterized protein n=1 Tax=Xylaria curta TaxID=42375 RepID=A0ACC1PHD8_9PEZI|nr:hypothetical protein NUW58_g2175 [Xylaria curta]
MNSAVVLDWLNGVCSSSPLRPEICESVVWPPSPQTCARRLHLQREAYRADPAPPRVERKRQQNHSFEVVKPDPDRLIHLNQTVKMPQTRRGRKKAALGLDNEPLQPEDVSAAVRGTDHHLETRQDSDKDDNNDFPVDQRSGRVDDEDPNITPRRVPPSTIMTSRSNTLFSYRLPRVTSSISNPASEANSPTRSSRSTIDSNQSRSKSPIKHADDLRKLAKPVLWPQPSKPDLYSRMQNHGSETLLKSINSVLRKGYLPVELRDILDVELGLDDSDDALYAKQPTRPNTESQLHQAKLLVSAALGSSSPPARRDGSHKVDGSLSAFLHLQSLLSELEALRTIVTTTGNHVHYSRTVPSWNENVHRPILNLAIQHIPAVGVENVTRANIARDFLPGTSAQPISLPPDSKLIDYAMVLRPLEHTRVNATRISWFIDSLEYRGFNQSPYYPLRTMPSGVFIETKVSSQKSNEAKAQLGMWLASWYGRISQFPCPAGGDDILPPPIMPVLLVEGKSWQLYFAFDTVSQYEVCGPIEIGSTGDLDGAYRLLAVLRILASWMATDFLEWVDYCLKQAEV